MILLKLLRHDVIYGLIIVYAKCIFPQYTVKGCMAKNEGFLNQFCLFCEVCINVLYLHVLPTTDSVYDKVSANVMISVQKMGESESGQIVF